MAKEQREYLTPTDLKHILFSKRANLYYLEKCRVMQKDGRVLYLTQGKKENCYYNIPIANTTTILLGTGTSITQAAVRMLSAAGVLIGFCGGGGTPLFSGTEIEWLSPQNEYRPTQYVQGWLAGWWEEDKRLAAAKKFQLARCNFLETVWNRDADLVENGIDGEDEAVESALETYRHNIQRAQDVQHLLTHEAHFAKSLYAYVAETMDVEDFVRNPRGGDQANRNLDQGNYLAYGLAASALWVLGIPHGFALMHGKTRRGALVFDVADLVKDTLVLPFAFIAASEGLSGQEFREMCLNKLAEHKALDYMYEKVKAQSLAWKEEKEHHDDPHRQSEYEESN